MAYEQVKVSTDGYLYEGWESVSMEWSIDDWSITALISTTEVPKHPNVFDQWNFPPGTPIEVWATGHVMMTGMVYSYNPSVTPTAHNITIEASSNSRHLVESSVYSGTGFYENTTDIALLQKWGGHHGIDILNFTSPDVLQRWQIRQGATNFAEASRMFQESGKLGMAMPFGDQIAIIKGEPFNGLLTGTAPLTIDQLHDRGYPGLLPGGGSIIQGQNVLKMSAKLDCSPYQDLRVVGQVPNGTSLSDLQPEGTARNSQAVKGRFKKIISQRALTAIMAQRRADWELARSVGASMEVNVTVPGWRDDNGQFWWPNTDVYCFLPYMQVDCILRIGKVVYKQNLTDGTVTDLTLSDPNRWIPGDIGHSTHVCNSGPFWAWPF